MRGERMLRRGRKRAEERMDAVCVVSRPGSKSWDEIAGEWVYLPVEVYVGICRVKGASTGGRKADAAGQLLLVTSPEVHLPADTVGVEVKDEVVVTSCQSRPSLAGRRFVLKEPVDGSQVTALRYRVEATDGR